MAGANIFVMYTDGQGNVTVSARLGKGYFQPQHDTAANITLLEGSGVANGNMVANVQCDNCASWSGGSMDFSSNNGNWIYAMLSGNSLDSTDLNENISEHQDKGIFTWQFSAAKGGADVNPFVAQAKTATSGSTGSNGNINSNTPKVVTPPSPQNSANADVSSATEVPPQVSQTYITAHGTLSSIAFLVILPTGAIVVRLLKINVWVHAGIQALGYAVIVASAGLGIWIADTQQELMNAHPIIGMILLGVLFTQPITGYIHHRIFKKRLLRTATSHEHIWVGRGAVILGMINGGLGLQLTGETKGYTAAYSVVAGVVGVTYLGVIVYSELKKRKTDRNKTLASRRSSDEEK